MKKNSLQFTEKQITLVYGIEPLTIAEMHQIRGGRSDEKSRTKEVDVYDNRER